jgi:hypothetical protein
LMRRAAQHIGPLIQDAIPAVVEELNR